MSKHIKIIGLYGAQKAGKSSVAKTITQLDSNWARVSFATPIRQMLNAITNSPLVDPFADKEQPLDILCGRSVRYALQRLGTEWGRNMIGSDIWIKVLEERIKSYSCNGIVIDDLRMQNEMEFIKSRGGCIVKVVRDLQSNEVERHTSELDWHNWTPDYVVNNNSSMDDSANRTLSFVNTFFNNN